MLRIVLGHDRHINRQMGQGPSVTSSSSLVQFSTQSQVSGTETTLNSKAYGVDVAEHVLVSVAELAPVFKA